MPSSRLYSLSYCGLPYPWLAFSDHDRATATARSAPRSKGSTGEP